MAKEWIVQCKDCGQKFGYSDWSYRAGAGRGQSRPERCPECRKKHNRQTALMGLAYFDLKPRANTDTSNIHVGQLGALSHPARKHQANELPSGFDPSNFGVSDDDIRAVFNWLGDPKHQVAVVVGPTGSGKSTVLPYRLIYPPEGIPEDQFTRYGQVLVTQPRIQATRNTSAWVAKDIYGSSIGSGFDVGFRYKNNPYSDWRNRLVYATDGTLINWLVNGQIANLSVIMIDEAHERSLNIDLILGLLKKLLPRYPHLKLIVASATIDSGLFIDYFGTETAKLIEFQGKRKFTVDTFFMEGSSLPYDDLPRLLRNIPAEVARKVIWLLEEVAAGNKPTGDILAFLQGEKPIEQAVAAIRQAVKSNGKLNNVDVYPLYTTLPQGEQDKALLEKPDPTRRRVVVTTNVAETSLTVKDIVYVVDSGLINEAQWNPVSQTKQVVTVLHSQAGCKQRWGRGGRVRDGQAYCLYTEKQFSGLFPEYTIPQIQRSDLETVVLAAKAAGIDDLTGFDWIQKPPQAELERAPRALQQIGALDQSGYLTEHGLELQSFGEEPAMANLMAVADRFSCAIEMATVLPMIKIGGLRFLFHTDRKWDAATRRAVDRIHQAMKKGCRDDLELCLKLYTAWSEGQWEGRPLAPGWAVRREWPRFIPAFLTEMCERLGLREKAFRQAVASISAYEDLHGIVAEYALVDQAKAWLFDAEYAFRKAERAAWGKAFFINDSLFRDKIEPERTTFLDSLSGHKKEDERRPVDFDLLDKVRILMAYCLPNRTYERNAPILGTPETDSSQLCACGYHPRSVAPTPSEGISQDFPAVQINLDSVCYGQCPDDFVCAKQQIVVHPLEPNTPPVPVMHVSYLSLVRPEWLDGIASAGSSPLSLGKFIAKQLRRPETGEVQAASTLGRLFLDQAFPVSSRYECVVTQGLSDKDWQVKLLRLVSEPHEVVEGFRGDEPEINPAIDIVDVTESSELIDTVLTEEDAPVLDPEENVVPAWVDLADDSPDTEVAQSDVTGAARTIVSQASSSQQRDTRADESKSQTWPEGPRCQLTAPGQVYQVGQTLFAEIVDYSFALEEPTILLKPVPERDPFDMFVECCPVGKEIAVIVIDHDERPGDFLVSLVVKEPVSDLEILLEPEDVTFSTRGFAVKEIPVDTPMQVVVEAIDRPRQRVYLSSLPMVEKHREEWLVKQKSRTGVYEADGIVKEIVQGRVHLVLKWSEPEHGLIHVASVAGRGLHKESPEAYKIGEVCHLRLQFSDNDAHARLEVLPEEVKPLLEVQGAFKNLYWQAGNLYFHGRMTYKTRNELRAVSEDGKYRNTIDDLYRVSNQFWVNTVDAEWSTKVPAIGTEIPEARVCDVVDFGAFVELQPGIRGLVRTRDMSWDGNAKPDEIVRVDDIVRVRVVQVDLEKREIGLSMLMPENDPLIRYHEGDRARGQVGNVTEYGAFVELEPGVSGLVHKSKMWGFIADPRTVVKPGNQVLVQIIGIDPKNRKLSLSMQLPENDPFPKYHVGDQARGHVTQVKEYGAFVELEPGVSGLLHNSQMRGSVKIGDELEVVILKVDIAKRQLSFGVRPHQSVTPSQPTTSALPTRPPVMGKPASSATSAPPLGTSKPVAPPAPISPVSGKQAPQPRPVRPPLHPGVYRAELRIALANLPKLLRKPRGLLAALLGSGAPPIEDIKQATRTDIQVDTATGVVVVTGRSQEAVERAVQRIKAAL